MNWDINTPQGMEAAKLWTIQFLGLVKEGGVWAVPRNCSTYKVSHKNKTLTRTGLMPDSAINKVAKAIGWTVIENNPQKEKS